MALEDAVVLAESLEPAESACDGGAARRTRAAAGRVPSGCGTGPATATAPGTCRRRCATRCCADRGGRIFQEHYRSLVGPL